MNHYDAAYLLALPLVAPAVAWKRWRHGKYRESLPGMLGKRLPPRPLPPPRIHRCWMHSVSVGETIAAGAVHQALHARVPDWEFLATTTTETGQAQARKTLAGVETFAYAPADFTWTVRAFHRAYRPSLYLFFETEIWPNNLATCAARDLPVFFVNGSLSERSATRYAKLPWLFRGPLSVVRHCFMQTEEDAERMARVLGSDERIEVSGNVKFDALPQPLDTAERATIRTRWGVREPAPVVIAGSTHAGEEETIWKAYRAVQDSVPGTLLIIAPRHPERFDTVAEELRRLGAPVHRTSGGPRAVADAKPGEVVLLDEMGVLAKSYGAAEIALVAGSWCSVGGHNLLEAAVHGIPVLRGPQMHEQPDIVRVLGPDRGAPMVPAERLGTEIARLLKNDAERRRLGELARDAAASNRGAAQRTVERMLEMLAARG